MIKKFLLYAVIVFVATFLSILGAYSYLVYAMGNVK